MQRQDQLSPGNRKLESNEVGPPQKGRDELILGQAIMPVQGMGRHRGDGCAWVRSTGRGLRPHNGSTQGGLAAAGAASGLDKMSFVPERFKAKASCELHGFGGGFG